MTVTLEVTAHLIRTSVTDRPTEPAVAGESGGIPPALPEADVHSAHGRALRKTMPRRSHAIWNRRPEHPTAIALLEAQSRFLRPKQASAHFRCMLQSPLAFLQGAAIVMAADLADTPSTGMQVQLCGNAHLGNFGIVATPERTLRVDVLDYSETLPGPWEWDVKRLAASLLLAARENCFNSNICREIVHSAVGGYRRGLRALATMQEGDLLYWQIPSKRIRAFLGTDLNRRRTEGGLEKGYSGLRLREFGGLVERAGGMCRFRDNLPSITRHSDGDAECTIRGLLGIYRRTLQGYPARFLEGFELVDAAFPAGSTGNCHLALLQRPDGEALLLQITEARASLLTRHLPNGAYRNQGQRVVAGQRLLAAEDDLLLGWVRNDDGRIYTVRRAPIKVAPTDTRLLSSQALARYAALCGTALARAHARSGDRIHLAAYLGKSDRFDRAIVSFAEAYADQTERDHRALIHAVRSGRVRLEDVGTAP